MSATDKRWTEAREQRLRELYGDRSITIDDVGRMLNSEFPDLRRIARNALYRKCGELGLRRSAAVIQGDAGTSNWPAARAQLLRELYTGTSLSVVAITERLNSEFPRMLPVSKDAVYAKCGSLGIRRREKHVPNVPRWVPDSLSDEYRDLQHEFDEYYAASVVRRLKAEMIRQEAFA